MSTGTQAAPPSAGDQLKDGGSRDFLGDRLPHRLGQTTVPAWPVQAAIRPRHVAVGRARVTLGILATAGSHGVECRFAWPLVILLRYRRRLVRLRIRSKLRLGTEIKSVSD